MSQIRNTCVARGSVPANSNTTIYTVPTDFAFICKSINFHNATTTQVQGQANAIASDGTHVAITPLETVPNQSGIQWSGWTVLNSGDSISLGCLGATMGYWIAGALLPFAP